MRTVYLIAVAFTAVRACPDDAVAPKSLTGTWGGENAAVIVDDTSAHVHIGCTVGNITEQLVPDASGRFNLKGQFNITAYPVYRPPDHPARFSGAIRGRVMTLTVTLTDTAVTIGPVRVEYGKEPHMGPCPICREPGLKP